MLSVPALVNALTVVQPAVLRRLNVAAVLVISPPFTARSPPIVTSPSKLPSPGRVTVPSKPTLNLDAPPTCKSINREVLADAVLVTFTFIASNLLLPLFQVLAIFKTVSAALNAGVVISTAPENESTTNLSVEPSEILNSLVPTVAAPLKT